jgi:hypothetical protein
MTTPASPEDRPDIVASLTRELALLNGYAEMLSLSLHEPSDSEALRAADLRKTLARIGEIEAILDRRNW